ncbi:hypothetical protein GUITHDRAFT_148966 [Guillardia theta CCMP2712]|uniref:PDZ domain-containing protein n=1 Tax=Guillardia theta (strain CCMP2712) TaxID=905079 RepID=L1I6T1_GUITC|nr:hypothetical protein GUITHDRAFT_148966 [Guillardia theta CCMP2712]EKX31951.1 hypothetical protein GUITHDRAFT_148966 [Guillardia theta CCMP2712]|eukprot:XP_005818931.1 hypothetical protein GUITHDRAFT_148966 [Guillardia theta CCMP2712]
MPCWMVVDEEELTYRWGEVIDYVPPHDYLSLACSLYEAGKVLGATFTPTTVRPISPSSLPSSSSSSSSALPTSTDGDADRGPTPVSVACLVVIYVDGGRRRGPLSRARGADRGDYLLMINNTPMERMLSSSIWNFVAEKQSCTVLIQKRSSGAVDKLVVQIGTYQDAYGADENEDVNPEDPITSIEQERDMMIEDSVGLGLKITRDARGRFVVHDMSPFGSARWSGKVNKGDVLTHVNGEDVRSLSLQKTFSWLTSFLMNFMDSK